jgi:SNF2 family DNA or RNA helicase
MILKNESTSAALYPTGSAETAEEIIGVLTAISVVSKRMAKKLALLEQRTQRKKVSCFMEKRQYAAMPIKASLYQHQRDAFELACRLFGLTDGEALSQGTALLMEMGTGKTITSIAVTGALYQTGHIRRVLVVAPLSIVSVWDEEFQKFAGFDYTLAVLNGTSAKKADTLRSLGWYKLRGRDDAPSAVGCGGDQL